MSKHSNDVAAQIRQITHTIDDQLKKLRSLTEEIYSESRTSKPKVEAKKPAPPIKKKHREAGKPWIAEGYRTRQEWRNAKLTIAHVAPKKNVEPTAKVENKTDKPVDHDGNTVLF